MSPQEAIIWCPWNFVRHLGCVPYCPRGRLLPYENAVNVDALSSTCHSRAHEAVRTQWGFRGTAAKATHETARKEWAARPVSAPKMWLCGFAGHRGCNNNYNFWRERKLSRDRREARVGVPANRCAPGVAARRVLRGEPRACWGAQAFNLPGYNSNRLIIPVVDHSR